jgi:hypothetical protein
MRRKLFTLAAGVSAMLCVASCVLWVRSFGRSDYYSARSSGSRRPAADRPYEVWIRERWIVSTHGVLYAYREDFEGDTDSATVAAIVTRRESEWGTSAAEDVAPSDRSRPGAGVHTRALLGWNWMWVWSEGYALDSREPREKAGGGPQGRGDDRIRVVHSAALIPWWAVSPPLAVLPALRLRRRLIPRRRRATGRCPACGYDLRATPDRCPECGGVPVKGVA